MDDNLNNQRNLSDVFTDQDRSYLDDVTNDETSRIEQGFAETEKSAVDRFDVSDAAASLINDRLDGEDGEAMSIGVSASKASVISRAGQTIDKARDLVDGEVDADDLGDEAIPAEDLADRARRRTIRRIRSQISERASSKAASAATDATRAEAGATQSTTSHGASAHAAASARTSEAVVSTSAAKASAAAHLGAEARGTAKGANHLKNFFRAIRTRRTMAAAAQTTRFARIAAIKRAIATGASKALSALAAPALGCLLAFIFMILGLSMCMGLVAPLLDDTTGSDANLEGNEKIVAEYLLDKGLDNVHVAAILANMRAESGGECGTDFDTGSVEVGSGAGHGLCQWTGVRWDGYDENGVKVTSANLLDFATSQNKEWTDLSAQLDFFWEEYSGDWSGNYPITQGGFVWGDPLPGTWVSGSKAGFLETSSVEEATMEFCYGWERPGIPHADKRKDNARWYLDALQGGGGHGQDYDASSEDQRAVVDACYRTPAADGGLCATWISNVYDNAVGWSRFGGNACDMYWNYCTSADRSELEVGMIIATPHSEPEPSDGWTYGHVGIYIGDNKVMHSIGHVATDDLDTWISTYSYQCTAKWGYPPH